MFKKSHFIVIRIRPKWLIFLTITSFLIICIFLRNSIQIEKITCSSKIMKTIAIDPGHGGIDGGTGENFGLLEKNINLDISLKLRNYLNDDFYVIMTREKDVSLENKSGLNSSRYKKDLHARKSIINSNNCALFISVHVNANPYNADTRGVMIFYYKGSKASKLLAKKIKQSVDKLLVKHLHNYAAFKSRVLPNDYYVLKETNCPGVLVEVGFITNNKDRKLLKSKKYREWIAKAISQGVMNYCEQ